MFENTTLIAEEVLKIRGNETFASIQQFKVCQK
jgi:hypothetical protein